MCKKEHSPQDWFVFLSMIFLVLKPSAAVVAPHRNPKTLFETFIRRSRLPMTTSSQSSGGQIGSLIANKPFLAVEEALAAMKDTSISTVFVDGSWWLAKDRDGRSDYEAGPRIEGSQFFDIDDIATNAQHLNPKGLPHMAPGKRLFAAAMDALGIRNEDNVIIYGTEGNMCTSRAWYTFRAMGHENGKVHLMQGSIKEWQAKGGPIESGKKKSVHSSDLDLTKDPSYEAMDPASHFCKMEDVVPLITESNPSSLIIDARPSGRFLGVDPEPRPGLRGGHMPGALNVPFLTLLDSSDYTKFKPTEELKALFESAGVDVQTDKRIVTTCGSGVTACVVNAALERCGREPSKSSVYDGSWIDWASDPDTPIRAQ